MGLRPMLWVYGHYKYFTLSVLGSTLDVRICFTSLSAQSWQSWDYALLLLMTSRGLYSAQYHRQHFTLQVFEQFGGLYIHNHHDKYPPRPDSNPVLLSFGPQPDRMGHRGRYVTQLFWRCGRDWYGSRRVCLSV